MAVSAGSIRFNTDSNKLEIYNGDQWWEVNSTSTYSETGGDRGFVVGGYANAPVSSYNGDVEFYNINTTGNTSDFFTVSSAYTRDGVGSDRTRAVMFNGYKSPTGSKSEMDYFTMSHSGGETSFGDNIVGDYGSLGGFSDSTRLVMAGGYQNPAGSPNYPRTNTMTYVTIQTTGNSIDFGDLLEARSDFHGCSSPTRGILMGGVNGPWSDHKLFHIGMNIVQSKGNEIDFGDMVVATGHVSAGSNAVRGISVGGSIDTPSPSSHLKTNKMQYITIASQGDAKDFGDMSITGYGRAIGTNPTRLCMMSSGTPASPWNTNVCEYIQIATTGNSVDFGDVNSSVGYEAPRGCSNGHGGLG